MKSGRVISYTERNVSMYDCHCLKKFMGDREAESRCGRGARHPPFRDVRGGDVTMSTKNAPRTVKDVPAQEFVIALAQYFRSTGKVRFRCVLSLDDEVAIARRSRTVPARDATDVGGATTGR